MNTIQSLFSDIQFYIKDDWESDQQLTTKEESFSSDDKYPKDKTTLYADGVPVIIFFTEGKWGSETSYKVLDKEWTEKFIRTNLELELDDHDSPLWAWSDEEKFTYYKDTEIDRIINAIYKATYHYLVSEEKLRYEITGRYDQNNSLVYAFFNTSESDRIEDHVQIKDFDFMERLFDLLIPKLTKDQIEDIKSSNILFKDTTPKEIYELLLEVVKVVESV